MPIKRTRGYEFFTGEEKKELLNYMLSQVDEVAKEQLAYVKRAFGSSGITSVEAPKLALMAVRLSLKELGEKSVYKAFAMVGSISENLDRELLAHHRDEINGLAVECLQSALEPLTAKIVAWHNQLFPRLNPGEGLCDIRFTAEAVACERTRCRTLVGLQFSEVMRKQALQMKVKEERQRVKRREWIMIGAIVVGPLLGAVFSATFSSLWSTKVQLSGPIDADVRPGAQSQISEVLIATVQRVIDGDTFVIEYDGELTSARLVGIDAPDLKAKSGPEAKAALEKLILGKTVRIEFPGPRKRNDSGCLLVKAYVADVDVIAEVSKRR